MKKWFLFLIFIACAIPSCELKEVGPEQTTLPVITDEGATIEDGGRVSSVQKVYVQANISTQYVTHENGLSSVTEAQQYSVYAI